MRQVIAGNWKMNGTREAADSLAAALRAAPPSGRDLLVCPPATVLDRVAQALFGSAVAVGAQDCSAEPPGAHTGDLSATMIRDTGARYVILGHSERRRDHGETDVGVRSKVQAAVAAGLVPIVCVGETDEQRRSGRETEIVGWQLSGSLPEDFSGLVAYEPVWAIGTGKAATADDIATMHAFVREELVRQFMDAGRTVPILYGGSVKADNAAAVLAVPEVNGALVGGASLDAAAFLAIAGA